MFDYFVDEFVKISGAKSDFAPGIPDKEKYRLIPTRDRHETKMNIQHHDAPRAGVHWDIRFQDPEEPIAYSWAIPKARLPKKKGEKLLAVRQPDHRASYMGWSGIIENGYGKGTVQSKFLGTVQVEKTTPGKVHFVHDSNEYLLHRTANKKNWLIRKLSDD